MAIDLYYTLISMPCRTVLMVSKHLNIDLNLKNVDMVKGEHLSPQFLKLNPTHTLPVIVDDGFSLWESRAIIQYLCNKYAPESDLYPKDPKKRAKVDMILNFDIGSYFNALATVFNTKIFKGIEPPEDAYKSLNEKLKLLDTFIGDNKYVAGKHLTIADLSIYSSATMLKFQEYDISTFPRFKEWFERLPKEYPYIAEINDNAFDGFYEFIQKIKEMREQKH